LRDSDSLLKWTPAEQVPPEVIPHLDQDIEFALSLIQPAGVEAWAVVMDGFLGWIERFGVIQLHPIGSPERDKTLSAIVSDYRNALNDIPDDLLKEAFDKTIKHHAYRNLPMFAEVRAHVSDELMDRKRRYDKLNTAKTMLQYRPVVEAPPIDQGPRTDEEKEMVRRINEITRAHLQKIA
jgi:hypothetical protein